MEATQRLEALRIKLGVPAQRYEEAQHVDPRTGEEETEDLARLARSVAVLGGHLEVRAVCPDETVTLLVKPDPRTE